ncbi:unannotated protein [freshwater metagenome]|uniref:Unannotated protein n=1 Tax=freshwater metagenome TaxID=449393 RepID=A0A6J7D5B8_9ZZZZ
MWWAQRFDAPEVERFTLDEVVRIAPSPAKTGTPDKAIQQTTRFPGPTGS